MYPFFIFNNINSKDKGILVNKLPPISKGERNYEEVEIPGRNGNLYIDKNTYKSFTYEITCTLMPEANIRSIAAWLNGSGKLTISTELDKYYDVIIKNQIDFEQTYRICNEFVVKFEVQPIAYSIEEKTLQLTEETIVTLLNSTYQSLPYIKIIGSGEVTLTINNKSVIIHELQDYIELDCELEEAYHDSENYNNKIECEEFPSLMPEKNIIAWIGNVSLVEIKYKEAFL